MVDYDKVTPETLHHIKAFGYHLRECTATAKYRQRCKIAIEKIGAIELGEKLSNWKLGKQNLEFNDGFRKALLKLWQELKDNVDRSVFKTKYTLPESPASIHRRNSFNRSMLRANGTITVQNTPKGTLKKPLLTFPTDDYGNDIQPLEFTAGYYATKGKGRNKPNAYVPVDASVKFEDYTTEQLKSYKANSIRNHFDERYRGEKYEGRPEEAFEAVLAYFNKYHKLGMFYGFSRHVTSETGVNSVQLGWLILHSNVMLFEAGSDERMHYVPYERVSDTNGYDDFKVKNDAYGKRQDEIRQINAILKAREEI